jgi:hypothetical protein
MDLKLLHSFLVENVESIKENVRNMKENRKKKKEDAKTHHKEKKSHMKNGVTIKNLLVNENSLSKSHTLETVNELKKERFLKP